MVLTYTVGDSKDCAVVHLLLHDSLNLFIRFVVHATAAFIQDYDTLSVEECSSQT